jgi:hypothetical protein
MTSAPKRVPAKPPRDAKVSRERASVARAVAAASDRVPRLSADALDRFANDLLARLLPLCGA